MSALIQQELKTLSRMIGLYCQAKHGSPKALCPDCQALYEYASERIQHCTFLPDKPVCAQCPVHCYQAQWRERIREVMRYSGPRLIFKDPLAIIRHARLAIRRDSDKVKRVRGRKTQKRTNHNLEK
ncbi:MAG: nitrous oxide-stimulated promoter family protein [Chloroflexi bacterium]|nr:nitrous oxide-stimulated promoter family protein [Chloroflexota bacterium]